jgi:predicted O-linked N-acetylglucosamine transferase (SPINDLY family)
MAFSGLARMLAFAPVCGVVRCAGGGLIKLLGSISPLQQAFALHQNGKLAEARTIYRTILERNPNDADALHLLGLIAYQSNELRQADELIAKAIRLDPRNPTFQANSGLVLHALGRLDEAIARHDSAIGLKPDYAEAHYNRGNALRELRRLDEALASYDRAIAIRPDFAEPHANRGNTLQDLRRPDEALASYDRAIALKPDSADLHSNRGNVLKDLKRFEEALASYDRAIAIRPDAAEACSNRGVTLQALRRLDDALASFDRAIAIRPGYAEAHSNRGNTLVELERLEEALESYDRAIAIRPTSAEAYSNRGIALHGLRRLDEALASYDRAIAIKPDYADALSNRGSVLKDRGDLDDAADCYRQAIAFKPDLAAAHGNLAKALTDQGRFNGAMEHYARALALDPYAPGPWRRMTCMLMYHPDLTLDDRFDRQSEFGRRMAARVTEPLPAAGRDPAPGRRLRIGWLSSDFYSHPVGLSVQPFFEHRDRSQFEAICYSDVRTPDGLTAWFRARADEWHSTLGLSDAAVAERIRADRIDVMLYLAGRFDENRIQVAAWRPAPIQMSLFDVASSGLEAIDYFVTDRLTVPPRGPEKFTERVLRLPNLYVHPPIPDAPDAGAPPLLANGHVTFGCFNNPAKVNDRVLELWGAVLARIPGSRLVLKYKSHYQSAQIRRRIDAVMDRYGIDPSRLELGGEFEDTISHLGRYRRIDIALDPFPFTGATTTFEALWMGVPVVTLEGSTVVSRWSSVQLRPMGLGGLVARTPEEYIDIAARLAADGPRLASLRSELRRRVESSVLCDGRRTNRHLERGLRAVWRKWCAGEPQTGTDSPRTEVPPAPDRFPDKMRQALALHQSGQLAAARTHYEDALCLRPDSFDALHLLGLIAYQTGDPALAEQRIARAIRINALDPAAHSNRGLALHGLRRLDDALASYDRAIALKPDYAEAHSNRGNTLKELGRLDDALASYDRAIAIKANAAETHYNRGNTLRDLKRLDDALAGYDRAIVIKPDYVEAHYNRGLVLADLNRLPEALASYDRAVAARRDYASAWCNRGNVLKDLGRLDEAADSYRQAIAVKPDLAEAHRNLGNVLTIQSRFDTAQQHYDRALDLDPTAPNLWRGLASMLTYRPGLSHEERFARQRELGRRMAEPIKPLPAPTNDRNPRRRLRIGWLSSDFRMHPVGRLLQPFFARRDRSRFEAICYAEVKAPDRLTTWFRGRSDGWHSTLGLSDAAVAQQIRADRIDVMIFLAGRFDENRIQVAPWRAAPVQMSMFDAATSGLEAMDYFIADRLMVPANTPEKFTERVLRLPNSYVQPALGDAPDVVAPPGLAKGHTTFGCFNNPAKVTDPVLELWAELLARVPASRLVLKYRNHYQSAELRNRIEGIMGRHGIARERLDLGGEHEGAAAHLAQYGRIDIALDPFPFAGSTTTFEALWMGVPVVTLEGDSLVSRLSSSQLRHIGLDGLVAATPADYVGIAAGLAADMRRLATLRSGLRQRVQGSVLCDAVRTTRYLERGLRAAWHTWCAGRQAAATRGEAV